MLTIFPIAISFILPYLSVATFILFLVTCYHFCSRRIMKLIHPVSVLPPRRRRGDHGLRRRPRSNTGVRSHEHSDTPPYRPPHLTHLLTAQIERPACRSAATWGGVARLTLTPEHTRIPQDP